MPAPQKLPSGRARELALLDISNSIVVNARQLSKAEGAVCAPGASALLAPSLRPITLSEQHSAKTLRPLHTPWGCNLKKGIASLEGPALETDY